MEKHYCRNYTPAFDHFLANLDFYFGSLKRSLLQERETTFYLVYLQYYLYTMCILAAMLSVKSLQCNSHFIMGGERPQRLLWNLLASFTKQQ